VACTTAAHRINSAGTGRVISLFRFHRAHDLKDIHIVNFDGYRFGSPAGLGFTADGKGMLVTVAQGEIVGNPTSKGEAIVRVTAEGKIDDIPVVEGLTRPMGLALAPQEFGSYAGQILVADIESIQVPVPMTQALQPDGKVYRVTSEGQLH
jgi:hypothetical protein